MKIQKNTLKYVLLMLITSICIAIGFTLFMHTSIDFDQKVVEEKLRTIMTPEYVSENIQQAIQDDKIDLALDYLNLAKSLHLDINSSLEVKIEEEDNKWTRSYNYTKDSFNGFAFGEGDSTAAVMGSTVADFTVIGDVRDLSTEALHYHNNEPIDEVTAGFAAFGIIMTVATIATYGSTSTVTGPSKITASLFKFANKTRKLSPKLLLALKKLMKQSINFKPIFSKISKLSASELVDVKKWKEIAKISRKSMKLGKIQDTINASKIIIDKSGNIGNALAIIKRANSIKDIKLLSKYSKAFGSKTKVVLKILGKTAFKLTKHVYSIMTFLSSLLFSITTFIFSAVIIRYIRKKITKRLKRVLI